MLFIIQISLIDSGLNELEAEVSNCNYFKRYKLILL